MEKFKTEKSKALFFETKKYLVDGVSSSFHKAHNEEYPICMTHGKGAHMYDVDGNDYIDYVAGFGPMILGYAPESVNAAVREQLGTNFCRRCNYCAPCSVGINIPSVFLFAGYLNRYDLGDWARDRYSTLTAKASACIECGACEGRCPYHLPIRKMMKECAEQFGE